VLDEVRITGLGVIEEAVVDLDPGLTVVTGETGAGKTMIVTALELLLGARADAGLVRRGVPAATVEARVRPVPRAAVDAGWAGSDDEELVVSRDLTAPRRAESGLRSRVRIGGRLATVGDLGGVLGDVVAVHGQGGHARLARPDVQREWLDRFAGEEHAQVLDAYREAHRDWRAAQDRIERLAADARDRARELDRLRFEAAEIDEAALDPDADTGLAEELRRLEHAEQLTVAAAEGAAALSEDGAGAPVGVAVSALRRAAGHDRALDALLERTEGLAAELADVRAELRTYAEEVSADPARLEELRRRERLIGDLQRKYGADIASVLAYAADAHERIQVLEADEDASASLEEEEHALAARTAELAQQVRAGREDAGAHLAAEVTRHLADLAMREASFAVRVEAADGYGPDGADRVVFELAANPGEPAGPLSAVASGGERARVALALEVALADVDAVGVLVFDEVDAGVGGEAAMAVGQKLAQLAAGGRQVLCVTHLAQLAAFADTHHVVEKSVRDGRTVTTVRAVGEDLRSEELARMLSGTSARGEGLAHARAVLAEADDRREQDRRSLGGATSGRLRVAG
jgi:DNA repair protein RecN (Recombination protein N)